ncbi:kelch-like protein [Corallococcus sp. AB011P]|uniref:RCC1 domain-containing protein n=1 Tax=Corallococcus sp. AB011P TaxID=2316735 RepID=UPI000EA39938|nr:PKD domain-containing protein [Corallococcus sp. AB011P]RKG50096.1 kelch-like protein [Corallococcus sp. AB011P]
MRRESRSRLALLALGLVLALTGCGGAQPAQEGSAQAVVTLPQALSASDVTRVELTTSGPGMTTRTDALVKTGGQWGGVLGQLPTGGGRLFSAQAFDASNTVRYSGHVTSVTIQAGQTTAVTLLLQEVNAPAPFENVAPRILSLVASPGTVAPSGQVALQATADDPNAGDTLTYAWTSPSGSFSAASSLTTTWTAPASAGQVMLTLTVTDSKGASASLSVTITVSTGNGSAAVNVSFNTWPRVVGVTALPSSIAVGQSTQVTASASDADGDGLNYQWTANCEGTWTNAASASASFTPSAQPSGGTCKLTVLVQDGRGGQGTGSLTLYVSTSPTTAQFPPEVVETFQSVASVPASGGTIVFRVKAKDPQSSALSFTWATSTGLLGTATSAATTSEVLWTAPACVPVGNPPSVTATVTNALGLSTRFAFALQGGAPCTASSGARLAAGSGHTLALKQDGTVWAWGSNGQGQLGDGTGADRLTPVQVQGLTGVAAFAAGSLHSLAVKQDGTVWAWGTNNGQLGDGTTTQRLTPVQVQGLTGVAALAAGIHHTLALKQDGTVWAWGYNGQGQLGDGTITQRLTPVQVQGLTGVAALAAGSLHSLALKQDGTVWAWGDNTQGQLGDGTTTQRRTPVQVPGLTGVAAITGGNSHSLALKQDGTVWAWGDNTQGQLGDGTTTQRLTPVQMQGLTGIAALAGGNSHSLALKQDGTVWAWGDNTYGRLGDGTTTQRLTPVQVPGLTGVATLAGGASHSLALKQDGTVWAWGFNMYGRLGDGTTTQRLTPVQVPGLSL